MEQKILIVDDEKMIRNLLEEAFANAGYDVRTAENATKAIEILREESIMVMYFDLKLPGMNGQELCRLVRAQNPLAFICAFTGQNDLFGLIDCRKAGFDDFFNKPAKLELLLESAQTAFTRFKRWKVDEYGLA
jgi:DNA-binding response OmpR family regulator